ncbi:hypothetical protein D3C80_1445540 [compost metagenome]
MAAISSNTKSYSPARNLPLEITMSISSAPFSTANRVSANLISRVDCPLGKAVETDATLIPELPNAFFASATMVGYTQIAATVGSSG